MLRRLKGRLMRLTEFRGRLMELTSISTRLISRLKRLTSRFVRLTEIGEHDVNDVLKTGDQPMKLNHFDLCRDHVCLYVS